MFLGGVDIIDIGAVADHITFWQSLLEKAAFQTSMDGRIAGLLASDFLVHSQTLIPQGAVRLKIPSGIIILAQVASTSGFR